MVAKTTIYSSLLVIILVAVNYYYTATRTPKRAWMTLLTNEKYLDGALTLDYSLKKQQSKYPLVVFHPDSIEDSVLDELHKRKIKTRPVTMLFPATWKDYGSDVRFYDCWSKLLPHGMVDYDRVVELDADMLVRYNADELMEMDLPSGTMAATHACVCNPNNIEHYPADWVPENCAYTKQGLNPSVAHLQDHVVNASFGLAIMNGGLQVVNPNQKHFNDILAILQNATLTDSFAFADQSLLSHYFKDRWVPLPYTYNALKTLRTAHSDIWQDDKAKIIHYILNDKPWDDKAQMKSEFIPNQWWWDVNLERLSYERYQELIVSTGALIKENEVVVFSKSYCPHCRAAKATLQGTGKTIKVLELDQLDDGPLLQHYLSDRNGVRTVPQIFVGGKFIGGNSDLQAIVQRGELNALLGL